MRVFLTGATGFIGSRILPRLLAQGHEVIAMTRSGDGARALAAAGAQPHLARLEEPAQVAAGAETADAVIHTAFDHNFETFAANCAKDAAVIAALGAVLRGSDRVLMVTSGTGMGDPGDGSPAREDICNLTHPNPRSATEIALGKLLEAGVNGKVMRLPQVHDTRRQGLISYYIQISRQQGAVAIAGEGLNRFPAVHVEDAAALYALALDTGGPGARFHAVAEEGIAFREIAAIVAARLGLPLVSFEGEALARHLGWFAGFAGLDMPASSTMTRDQIDWHPVGPTLLEDLRACEAEG
ncbi:NAD-dependent epimerase/dehydratase family protein [Paenirhodobacter sp. CAU 1674]|uniref:NAD-dependent epimerase/dehydratase family protein n=1 Tax=Paenirhodobacter sp. CAU 1674 TaxID=3032596 RepID=UPI0023DB9EA2|nr:NAD-dependent epimerase/dehydratase family protein [Paenirhodobacter sp. CAU 1674]MDF2143292.1 NAD-dependent epimerase/dehydratase family protein [Paenirhodobacter sp. CAU 1674]